MPTYEYRCDACSHAFELFQQMTAPVKRKCPKCGKSKLRRLIGIGSGVLFKGGGFYQTDYRSDSYKKAAEAERKSLDKPAGDEKATVKPNGAAPDAAAAKTEPAKPPAKSRRKKGRGES